MNENAQMDCDALYAMQVQQEVNASTPSAVFQAKYDVVVDSDDIGINLPESALLSFSAHHDSFVFLKLSNALHSTVFTHVASGDWTAPDGKVILPRCIAQRLQINAATASTARICCEHATLSALQKLVLQPLDAEFCKHPLRRQYILNALRQLRCLTENDIIQVAIGQSRYELRVHQVVPGPAAMLTLADNFELKLEAAAAAVPQSVCANDDNNPNPPIVSSIASYTKGNTAAPSPAYNDEGTQGNDQPMDDNDTASREGDGDGDNHTMAMDLGEDDDEECEDNTVEDNTVGLGQQNDYSFSDPDVAGWSDPEELDEYGIQQLQYVRKLQQQQQQQQEQMEEEEEEECNTLDEGQPNSVQCKPTTIPYGKRAWICEHCSAINNLLESLRERGCGCNCCSARYRPGQQVIEAEDEDKPTPQKQVYMVWMCACERANAFDRSTCSLCGSMKPTTDLITFETDEKPLGAASDVQPRRRVFYGAGARKWSCVKCGHANDYPDLFCKICNHARWSDMINVDPPNSSNKVQQHDADYTMTHKLRQMANIRGADEYPLFGAKIKMNASLVKQFGVIYRNTYFRAGYNRQWAAAAGASQLNVGHMSYVPLNKDHLALSAAAANIKPFGHRAMSIDERTGWMVTVQAEYMAVLQPVGGMQFVLRCLFKWNSNQAPNERSMRVRFVHNNIYVFDGATYSIVHYRYDCTKNCVFYIDTIQDKYFSDANVKDIVVSDQFLLVLFDRWVGVYTLYPFQWYHAVAFSKANYVSVDSMEMSVFDDWRDRTPMQQEAFFASSLSNVNSNDENHDAVVDAVDEKMGDAEIVATQQYRPSITNFLFINAAHSVVAVHPSNPTYDMLCVAKNVKNGKSFCVSRQYGMFWISNESNRICQSSACDAEYVRTVCDLRDSTLNKGSFTSIAMDNKSLPSMSNVYSLTAVLYDDGFGISGRLLVECERAGDDCFVSGATEQPALFQMFNADELAVLKEAALRNVDGSVSAMCVYVGVYEMLYGTDLIEYFLSSPEFNPPVNNIAAVPPLVLDDAQNKHENDAAAESKQEDEADKCVVRPSGPNYNRLIEKNSRCLVNVNGQWLNAVVCRAIDDDMFELFIDAERFQSEDKIVVMSRLDAGLKYNEAIPLAQRIPETWKTGDLLMYYHPTLLWVNGVVTGVDHNAKFLFVELQTNNNMDVDDDDSANKSTSPVNYEEQAHNLYKLQDVVADCPEQLVENPGEVVKEQDIAMADAVKPPLGNEEKLSNVR